MLTEASFAHAWRKRSTLSYTRFMGQCCEILDNSSVPSDKLIHPFIRTSELLYRVNDHFSYDDIDNADIGGPMLLESAVTSFLGELKHIRSSISPHPSLSDNSKPILVSTIYIEMNLTYHVSYFDFDVFFD